MFKTFVSCRMEFIKLYYICLFKNMNQIILAILVMCVSAYGPEDDDGRGGSSQHKNHGASGGSTHNHLGANGHGQRRVAGDSQNTHSDGSQCNHHQIVRDQQQGSQGPNNGQNYS